MNGLDTGGNAETERKLNARHFRLGLKNALSVGCK